MGRNTNKSGGFTLVELMVVLAVLAVLLGIAVPSFRDITNRNRLTAVTNEMVGAIQLTRIEAVRRNARVVFCPTTDGSSCGGANWLRSIILAPGGEVVRELNFEGAGLTVLGSSNVNTGNQISFGASGFARAGTTAANRSGRLQVCSTQVNSDENGRDVMVTVSRVAVEPVVNAGCATAREMDKANDMRNHASTHRKQKGASLLEILIAILILAIGLLGIAALQAVTLRNMQGSGDRSVAVIQSYAMFDIMRANREDALDGDYDTSGFICEAPAAGDRIADEKAAWINQMKASMGPSACGNVDCAGGKCTVSIRWNETRLGGNEADASAEEHTLIRSSTL